MENNFGLRLRNVLEEQYENASKRMQQNKDQLPPEYQGFVDVQMNQLRVVYERLKKDANRYHEDDKTSLGGTNDPEQVMKDYKSHCIFDFAPMILLTDPKNIRGYNMTYQEYLNWQKRQQQEAHK